MNSSAHHTLQVKFEFTWYVVSQQRHTANLTNTPPYFYACSCVLLRGALYLLTNAI